MDKNKRISTILYLTVICAILVIPAVFINTQKDYISEVDNTMLPEFPAYDDEFFEGLNTYVENRLGFRTQVITAYQELNKAVFHYLVHPLYEYGKGDWIMTKRWDQAQTLHLDVPNEYTDAFAQYVSKLNDTSREHNAKFLFVMIPNKETVYYEKLSKGYNIRRDNETKSDKIIEKLEEYRVPHVYLKDVFIDKKNEILLYNKQYDAGHWNENGAFWGIADVIDYMIGDMGIDIRPLKMDDFDVSDQVEPYLTNSYISINEQVPLYTPINVELWREGNAGEFWKDYEFMDEDAEHTHMIDKSAMPGEKPRLLIYGDSYIGEKDKFFINSFSEVTVLRNEELPKIEYYLDKLQPDVVMFEATERVVGPDKVYDMEFIESAYEYMGE